MRLATRNRQDVIGDIIAEYGLHDCAEIGVGTGPTTNAVLTRFPGIRWLAVDCWPNGYPLRDGGFISPESQAERRARFMRVLAKHSGRVHLIEKDSVEAAAEVADGCLDLVFIDADHSYEGCKADIIAWRPKLKPGGWLMGHDYCPQSFPGVVQAVDELVPGAKIDVDFVWMMRT